MLTSAQRDLLAGARRAILATIAPDGRPRLVPVCFWPAERPDAAGRLLLYSPLDAKPKRRADPHRLARVRDLRARPEVSLIVDVWAEDWSQLAWLRLEGTAELLEPDRPPSVEHADAVVGLCDRYPQYRSMRLESRPLIRMALSRAVGWAWQAEGRPGQAPDRRP